MGSFFSWHVPHMMAGFMDFGVGVLFAAVLWTYGFRERPAFLALFAGAVFALLPDIDIVWPIMTGVPSGDHHELPTHFPLVMIPLATLGAWLMLGRRYALLAFLGVTWHFIHDSPEFGGGGIAWLWPWSSDYWYLTGGRVPKVEGMSVHELWGTANAFAVRELMTGTLALMFASLVLRSRHYAYGGVMIALGVSACASIAWFPETFGMEAVAHVR